MSYESIKQQYFNGYVRLSLLPMLPMLASLLVATQATAQPVMHVQDMSEQTSYQLMNQSTNQPLHQASTHKTSQFAPAQVAGCYSGDNQTFSLTSICLFADGTYFYPEHINQSGTYDIKYNRVVFTPKNRDLFAIYGRYNPQRSHGQGTQVYFSGFDYESLINFNGQGFHVMPVSTECLGRYTLSKYKHSAPISSLSLAHAPQETDSFIVFDYTIAPQINEILLIAQNPKPQNSRFSGRILTDEGSIWLQLSKNNLSMQKIAFAAKKLHVIQKIANASSNSEAHYELLNQDNIPSFQELKRYRLDKTTNRYIAKNASAMRSEGHYLTRYDSIAPITQSMKTATVGIRTMEAEPDCNL